MIFNKLRKELKILGDAIQKKDWHTIIDRSIIYSFLLGILFILGYKLFTNLEVWIFGTRNLVLDDKLKQHIPQITYLFLLILGFIKWLLNFKNPIKQIQEEKKRFRFCFKLLKRKYTIESSTETISWFFFILSILIFFLIKIPSWDLSFTMNHPMKYSTYAEPALHMLEHRDPFFMQRQYMHNPIRNSLGVGGTFSSLPILEWILLIFYFLGSKLFSFEILTHMTMAFVGTFSLVSIYLFLKKAINPKVALMAIFLLAVNPIFNLASFVTVYDTVNIGLTFLSFYLLLIYKENDKFKPFFISALLLGIGVAIKENILIWAMPAILIFLIRPQKDLKYHLAKLSSFAITILLPVLVQKISIKYFPQKNVLHFILFFVGVAIIIAFYRINGKIEDFFSNTFGKILKAFKDKKYILYILTILIASGFLIAVYSTEVSEEFLTDGRLILNIDMYTRFMNEQLIPYSTLLAFIPATLGLFILLVSKNKNLLNLVSLALLISSVVYLVLASKALFFHSYYWLFIIVTTLYIAALTLTSFAETFTSRNTSIIYLVFISLAFLISVQGGTRAKLHRERDSIYDLIEYVEAQDLQEDDGVSFWDQGDLTYLTFKTNLYRIYDTVIFEHEDFKKILQEDGLAKVMEHYNIRYVITSGDSKPDLTALVNAFSKEPLQQTSYRRTDIIFSELYGNYEYYQDNAIRDEIIEKNNLNDQVQLVKQFEDYSVYIFTPACYPLFIK